MAEMEFQQILIHKIAVTVNFLKILFGASMTKPSKLSAAAAAFLGEVVVTARDPIRRENKAVCGKSGGRKSIRKMKNC